ncbi:MAG: hypothetical protein GX620_16400 [Chloroflexi bacterium]|nr:hypothetical protein [Chloroflexota bacterium]
MTILWTLIGVLASIANGLQLAWSVSHLRPDSGSRVAGRVAASVWLRWGVTTAVLIAALHCGVTAALGAFVGLLLGRWPIVYLVHAGWATLTRTQRADR